MLLSGRVCLALMVLAMAGGASLLAQTAEGGQRQVPFTPLRPWSQKDLDRREGRQLYGLALQRQREDCLLEATKLLEEACRLDPEAVPPAKALIPLYVALCRLDDALATCRRALDQDPGDYEVWHAYAQQLKARGQLKEARTALTRAIACPGLQEELERRAQIGFDLGVLAEETQEWAQAIAAFEEVARILEKPEALLERGPVDGDRLVEQAASTQERIGKLCIQAGQLARAEAAFRKAQELLDPQPNAVQPVAARSSPAETAFRKAQACRLDYHLAQVCVAQGRPAAALQRLENYLRTQPQSVEAYELKVTLLKQLGRTDEIVPTLRAATERDPHNLALRVFLAQHYAEAGFPRQAEDLYKALSERSPTAEVYRGLFTLYHHERRLEEALQLLDAAVGKSAKKDNATTATEGTARARVMIQVIREDSNLAKAFLPVAHQLVVSGQPLQQETRYLLAVLASRTRQLDEAERFFRSCLDDGLIQRQSEGLVYDGLVRILWQARKYEAITQVCQQGLRQAQSPKQVWFHSQQARALALLGKTDEALAAADQAVEVADHDNRLYARLTRVDVLRHVGRTDQAAAQGQALLQEFRQADEVQRIRHSLSGVYSTVRDFPKAEEQLLLILRDDPTDATASNDLGYFWADQGKNLEEAERLIRKALDLDEQQRRTGSAGGAEVDQENAAYLDSLGWVLFRRGQVEAARTWLEKAAGLPGGEDDPLVWDHLGDVYTRLEQTERAQSAWRKALVLYETQRRRQADNHYREIKRKLELRP